METMGDLFDKLSISCIRLEKLAEKGYDISNSQYASTKETCDILKKEIDEYLVRFLAGEIKVQPPKNKIYAGEDASKVSTSSLGEAVHQLFISNRTLWSLEDSRRDKSLPDEKRLAVCDAVSVWNRKRNDWIDLINKILVDNINALHPSSDQK